jgi:hypothetical protein
MGESVTTKNGYLLVKHKGKWKRRWVSIINGQLMYYKNWKVSEQGTMENSLRPPL